MTSIADQRGMDAAQRQALDRDGWIAVDQLADAPTVAALRQAYDEVIAGADVTGADVLGELTIQVMLPAERHPAFAANAALDAAKALVAPLLGETVVTFDMLIYKPPRHPHETPWHQDAAYGGEPFAPAGREPRLGRVQVWVALDDVDAETGCMHFVPGHHHAPLLEHRVASGRPDSPRRLLELVDPEHQLDLGTAVAAPLRAGGATVHLDCTPHYTPANRSPDRARRAYIFNLTSAGG